MSRRHSGFSIEGSANTQRSVVRAQLAFALLVTATAGVTAQPAPSAKYAVLRIRIADRSVTNVLPKGSVSANILSAQLDQAFANGALDKAKWAEFNADHSIVVPWVADRPTSAGAIYSKKIVTDAADKFGEGPLAALRAATQANVRLAAGSINIAVPGTTNSIARPLSEFKSNRANLIAHTYELLRRGSTAEETELERLSSKFSWLAAGTPRVAVLRDQNIVTPTPPIYSVTVQVPCEDLAKYAHFLTATQAAQMSYSGCEEEAPNLSLMPVRFDPSLAHPTSAGARASKGGAGNVASSEQLSNAASPTDSSPPATPSGTHNASSSTLSRAIPSAWYTAVPSDATLARLRQILNAPRPATQQVPILAVVDDGFPSQQAYADTKAFFEEADTFMRSAYALPQAWYAPPATDTSEMGIESELSGFPNTTTGPRSLSGCEALESTQCRFHAKSIEKALSVFSQLLSGPQPVRVIWIPLFFAQAGAPQLAYRIHRFARIVPDDYTANRLGDPKALAAIQQEFFAMVHRRGVGYPAQAPDWQIERPYFGNVLTFLRAYSRASNTPVFVNLSWRTSADQFSSIPGRGRSRVILVTAAGNPCTPDANCAGPTVTNGELGDYNFLRFSTYEDSSGFVVADVDENGRAICDTARLAVVPGATAYQGGISDDCGTSFSSPRLAWLLAANERYTTDRNIDPDVWASSLRMRVAGNRDANACSPDNMGCLVPGLEQLFPSLGKVSNQ
jgi:hypothetical protein